MRHAEAKAQLPESGVSGKVPRRARPLAISPDMSRFLHLAVRPGSPPPRLGNWSRISCGRVAASHETATLAAWSEVFAGVCHPGPDPSSLASGTGRTASTQPSTKRRFQAVGCVEPVPAVPPADAAPRPFAPFLVFRTTSDAAHQSNRYRSCYGVSKALDAAGCAADGSSCLGRIVR